MIKEASVKAGATSQSMRQIAFVLILFTTNFFNNYWPVDYAKKNLIRSTKTPKHLNDTTFILKEKTDEYYHKIYIEENRKSNYYKLLTDFKFSKSDLEFINEYYKSFKKRHALLRHFNLHNIATQWLPLYKYKNSYYLYAPSDWGNTNRKMITNSLLFYWYIDGPYPYLLTSFSKINPNQCKITSRDFFGNSDVFIKPADLKIHIIDPKKNISVWEYWSKNGQHRYGLYVAKEHAKDFDIIINYCEESKVPEFDFDQIDFKKLLIGK